MAEPSAPVVRALETSVNSGSLRDLFGISFSLSFRLRLSFRLSYANEFPLTHDCYRPQSRSRA